MNKPEQAKIEVTVRVVRHTVVSGKWHFHTSRANKKRPPISERPFGIGL